MKTLTLTLNPRGWVQTLGVATRNTFLGIVDTLRNPRLLIGIGVSVLLHASLLLFLVINKAGKAIDDNGDEEQWIPVVVGGNENPKVTRMLKEQGGSPFTTPDDVVNRPLLTPTNPEFQAMVNIPKDATDLKEIITGDMLVINISKQKTTEEILASEPVITLRKGVGTTGNTPFMIPTDNSAIKDLSLNNPLSNTKPIIKNIGTANDNNTVNQNNVVTKGGSFSIEGDLSASDIVSSVMPEYPYVARVKGLSNVYVSVDFTVNSQGKVSQTMIVSRSSGYPEWDANVKQALSKWIFKPTEIQRRSGRITFRFVLT